MAAELFLDDDFSLALRKLLARLRSLLKLLTLVSAGLSALCGVSRGELGGSGERHVLGEGDLCDEEQELDLFLLLLKKVILN